MKAALAKLDDADGVRVLRTSSVYETEPVGEITDQPDFYNAVTEVGTSLDPHALLAACKRIETELGRQPGGPKHGPRPIDVDLLIVDGVTTADEQLVLPHPEVATRRFVLAPLLELEPDLALPDGTRLAAALAAFGTDQRATPVDRLGSP
jgi:2-amino-4-hydroxy-6-hydroxymethyldihydropteridine diphosphokinase